MVPFPFENIARSASYDAPHASPVSDAARATHESFESHLQRAATTTAGQPTHGESKEDTPREPSAPTSAETPSNEPVRPDAGDVQQEDGDVRTSDDGEAASASETSRERSKEDIESGAASNEAAAIGVAADELTAAIQDAKPQPSGDASEDSERAVAAKAGVAPAGDERAELDASLATNAEEAVGNEIINADDDAPVGQELKRINIDRAEPAHPETPAQRVKPSETKETVAAEAVPEAAPAAAATIPDDESPPGNNTQQRHARRGTLSPNQRPQETTDAAAKPVAINVVETAKDGASEQSSRQRQHHQEAEGLQPNGKTNPADTTASSSGTPSRFAQHLLARTEAPNARGVSITDAEQARFVDRVARAVQATGERNGTLRLRLSPPELGALTLEVKVEGGVVSARVDADTPAARSLLLENLPLLRERLAEQGMRVDQFDVDLPDRQAGGTSDGLQQHDQQHEDRPRAKATLPESDEPQTITNDTPIKRGNEQLNIIV